MPNISLIKEDGMPLVIPAGSIYAILKAQNQLGSPDVRAVVCYQFRGFAFTPVIDTPEDIFQALQANLNSEQKMQLSEDFWLILDALPPLEEVRTKITPQEAGLGDDVTIESTGDESAVLGTISFKLPEDLSPVGKCYLRKEIFRGYEGFRSRHTPTGELLEMPKGTGMIKFNIQLGEHSAADFCALTPENMQKLNAL